MNQRLTLTMMMLLFVSGCRCDANHNNHEWFIVVSDHLSEEVTMRFCRELREFVTKDAKTGDVVHVISFRGHLAFAEILIQGHTPRSRLDYQDTDYQLTFVVDYLKAGAFVEGTEQCGFELEVIPWTIAELRRTDWPSRVLVIGAADRQLSYRTGCACPNPHHSLKQEIAARRFHQELASIRFPKDF